MYFTANTSRKHGDVDLSVDRSICVGLAIVCISNICQLLHYHLAHVDKSEPTNGRTDEPSDKNLP